MKKVTAILVVATLMLFAIPYASEESDAPEPIPEYVWVVFHELTSIGSYMTLNNEVMSEYPQPPAGYEWDRDMTQPIVVENYHWDGLSYETIPAVHVYLVEIPADDPGNHRDIYPWACVIILVGIALICAWAILRRD